METKNVAIVGIENSHAEEIIRYLNVERPAGVPVRVVALVAGEPDRTRELAELGGIERIVAESSDLLGSVDALIVTSRDGALHRAHAVPFLEAGTPVWVDKPLAASVADAQAIVAAAERGGTVLTSSSALRWVADTDAIAEGLTSIGELQAVTVTGPADAASPYSGIFFYGIHVADVAQRLVPGDPEAIDLQRLPSGVVARYRVGGVLVTLEFIRPDGDGQVPFRATAVGGHGVVSRDIVLGADYVQPGVDAFARMLATGAAPIPTAQLLAPIAVLETVAREGAAVAV
ncbi:MULTISPECIES: Gfo/Idh/MocA family oxidoreductase [unclassified Microbacterium]|uniref:Gfo/Idh/MocA family oxidoreductase n=1 Tax=unclassified Microbacterium TaxID=2609290 RepID=UPI0016054E77|nr:MULTISPECIES: Gfo/Idh/MocA family oxidoreductase [unclassified Microbacterium]QNA91394.1 Gfo/Idh/MocA family oxidoreductase [Microbacterium sp. Se63.02b]QYM64559.1 Gfo/Idh/MocA family oxidoreductase [Microbacterium sp. Se5.02b]